MRVKRPALPLSDVLKEENVSDCSERTLAHIQVDGSWDMVWERGRARSKARKLGGREFECRC